MHWWSGVVALIPSFISILAALSCALIYKAITKRTNRRSPLAGRKVGKLPGQALVDRISDHEGDLMGGVTLMYVALPTAFMAWVGMRVRLENLRWGGLEWFCLAVGIVMFGLGLYTYVRAHRARERARDGLLAEAVTGMQLNRLIANGCIVMHDLPGEGFNVDHVVVAPRGVYAVETKSFRKPRHASTTDNYRVVYDGTILKFPDFPEKRALEQARSQAQWLSRVLREALGRDIPVIPALSLPGWMIEQTDATWRSSQVKVFNPMGGGTNFMSMDIPVIDENTRGLVKSALAVRYPDLPA